MKSPIIIDKLLPVCLGICAFILVMGFRPLDITNTTWFPACGDPIQGWLGWAFFRNSPWTFPIGLNPQYGLDMGNSIVYTDSIPLLAFLFKPFSPLLPAYFHYSAIWLLICYILQAVVAYKLISLFSQSRIIRLLGSAIFIFAPVLLWRLQAHFTLVGQFLILAALYLCLEKEGMASKDFRTLIICRSLKWLALLCACALIHAYFLAMAGFLWLADMADRNFEGGGVPSKPLLTGMRVTLIEIVPVIGVVLLCCWQAGYFVISPGGQGGFGFYKMNVLAPFDAEGSSYILGNIFSKDGEGEGFNFLGSGVLFLCLFALVPIFTGKTGLLKILHERCALFCALIFMSIFSLSNDINIGRYEVLIPKLLFISILFCVCAIPVMLRIKGYFSSRGNKKAFWQFTAFFAFMLLLAIVLAFIYCVPFLKRHLEPLLQNFRCTGRFFWPMYYMIILTAIYVVIKNYKKNVALALIVCALVIQIVDTTPLWGKFRDQQNMFITDSKKALSSPFWEKAAKKYSKVRTLSFVNMGNNWEIFGPYAAYYGLGTDIAYFARFDVPRLMKINAKNERMIKEGKFEPDTFYVVNEDIFRRAKQAVESNKDKTTLLDRIDNFYVIAPGWFDIRPH